MKTADIPFNKHLGLEKSRREGYVLQLPLGSMYHNHLGTVHASAQFALAEAATGEFLVETFPGLSKELVGVVRDVNLKYKRPAEGVLYARVTCAETSEQSILDAVRLDGMTRLEMRVAVVDVKDDVTLKGKISWILQKLSENFSPHQVE